MCNHFGLAGLLLLIAATAPVTFAQGARGSIAGVVTDPSGGTIPAASVTLIGLNSGFARRTTTNSYGRYVFALLDAGPYKLELSASGFRDLIRSPITVRVGETTQLALEMVLGSPADEAVVVSEEPLLRMVSPTLGTVFTHRQLVDLPLVTRNFTQLLALEPGVIADLPNAAAFGTGSQGMSVSGSRYYDNSVLIDGINAVGSIMNGYTGIGPGPLGGIAIPAPDAIQEFKVQTSLYSAEYGRAGGASVNLIARGGTNELHGSGYEFFRNEALNANEFFYKRSEIQNGLGNHPPILRENQFGGTIGGPIRKNRTFLFGSYQGTRQLNGASTGLVETLPRYPLLPQDRSSEAVLRQELGAIYGGRNGFPFGLLIGSTPVNTILPDGSNISEVAIRTLMMKLPNGNFVLPSFAPSSFNDQAGGRNGGQVYSNAGFSFPSTYNEDQFSLNLDHLINTRQTLSTRFFSSNQLSDLPAGNLPGFTETQKPVNRNFVLAHTFTAGPELVNEFRGGYTRITNPAQAGDAFSASDVAMLPAPGSARLPQIAIATNGLTLNGAQGSSRDVENMFTLSDTVSKVLGSHSLRFGTTFVRHRLYMNSDLLKAGQLIIYSFEDFLLGSDGTGNNTALAAPNGGFSNLLASAAETGSFEKDYRFNDLSFFLQDDWHVGRTLTVNLGLRYDYFAWPVDVRGRIGNFDPDLIEEGAYGIPPGNSSYTGFTIARSFQENFPGVAIPNGVKVVSNTTLAGSDLNNFGPRIGFAWQPLSKLSVRGGYGIFYPRVNAELAIGDSFGFPFNSLMQTSFGPSGSLADPFSHLNLPPDSTFPQWTPRVYDPNAVAPILIAPIDPNVRNPYVQQWNFSIQRELTKNLVVQLAYVGSHGLRLVNTRAANMPAVASSANPIRGVTENTTVQANIQSRSPVAGILADRGLALTTTDAESKYHAAIASVQQRFSRSLQFLSSFSFSKSIDNNTLLPTGSVSNAQVPGDASLQHYGLSAFDRSYRWSNSFVYDLPSVMKGTRGLGRLLNGWQAAGIFIVQSGQPLTFTVQTTTSVVKLQGYESPDILPGKTLDDIRGSGPVNQRLNNYFASPGVAGPGTVFAAPSPTGYGSLGRGLNVRAPGQKSLDAVLTRRFQLRENATIQFRCELYNVFNWVNFGAPATNVSTSNFGTISSTTTAPRVVQFAVKFEF
ncbi:MAG TPA: carboxypeptidase regulatory-like domain-containing protein [Bryobacteraceae bacterium]|nr:carboxypeptidase regulatory-like domain-containing protein [Bryobacteraceae bacterium]